MSKDFDNEDVGDVSFFAGSSTRSKIMKTFASVDLSDEARPGKKTAAKAAKKSMQKNPSGLDSLEAAEDEMATQRKNMQKMQEKSSSSGKRKKEDDFDDALEKKARSWAGNESVVQKKVGLPVRNAGGQWIAPEIEVDNEEQVEAEEGNNTEVKDQSSTTTATTTESEVKEVKKLSAAQIQETIALTAMAITENADENVSKLKELLKFTRFGLNIEEKEYEVTLIKAALVTLLAVFKDIMPGYYIRPLTKEEKESKISNDVKKLRSFESTIVSAYREYLKRLQEILQTNKKGDVALVGVALGCLGELACFAGHFNFYDSILTTVAAEAFSGDSAISEQACKAIERVFKEDEIGKPTWIMTRLLSDALHSRGYIGDRINVRVIEPFLQVKMRHVAHSKGQAVSKADLHAAVSKLDAYKKKQGHMSKAQKKALKAELAESTKLAQAEAEYSQEEKAKWSSDILKFIFRVYFGVLKKAQNDDELLNNKNRNAARRKMMELLPTVLAGLARFAQYLSIDFYADLLVNLKRIITNSNALNNNNNKNNNNNNNNNIVELPLPATLHTILTVSQINAFQEGNTATANIGIVDLKFYFCLFYRQINRLPVYLSDSDNLKNWSELEELWEQVATKLFFGKRHVPAERVGSFVHRLVLVSTTLATQLEASKSTPAPLLYLMNLTRRLLDRHSKSRAVLDSETFGVGSFLPNCDDPDLGNPFSRQVKLDKLAQCKWTEIKNCVKAITKLADKH